MANTRISNLTASASNLASTDLAPVVQTTGVGPVKMTGLQLAGGLLGSATFNGATVTTSQPVLNLTQTWNAGAVTFTGLRFNATDTASASGSLLLDLQVGGTSRFYVTKNGEVNARSGSYNFPSVSFGNTGSYIWGSGTTFAFVNNGGGTVFTASAAGLVLGGSDDCYLRRAAAATLQLGAADAAGSAIAISSVASNQLTLASNHGLSNGAAVIITGSAAPSGTSLNTLYYARSISAAVLELYDTYQNAITTSGTTGRVSVTTAGTSASVRLSTPFQTFQPQSFTGTDIPGQPFIIKGSRGTGTGAGGSIIFQVAPAGSSGTAQNAYSTALTIVGDGRVGIGSVANQTTFSINTSLTILNWLYISSGNAGVVFDNSAQNTIATRSLGVNGIVMAAESGPALVSGGNSGWSALGGRVSGGGEFTWSSVTHDALLYAFAENNLVEQRRRTNAQRFNVYNTYTSSTNYETFKIDWITTANTCLIGTEKGSGGGTARALALQTDGTTRLTIAADGTTAAFTGVVTAPNLATGRTLGRAFTPLDNQPPASNFATLDTRNSIAVLDFDDATDEFAVFASTIPQAATISSGLTVIISWAATSATSGACVWGVQFAKLTGVDLDVFAFDTATTATTTTSGTSGVVNTTTITVAVADTDGLAAGDCYAMQVYRDANAGGDTMTGDAELIAVEIRQVA